MEVFNTLPDVSQSLEYVWLAVLIVGIGASLFIIGLTILFVIKKLLSLPRFLPNTFSKRVFRLTIPKQSLKESDQNKEAKEILSGIENFYANLGGLKALRGLKTWLFGRYDNWSFEIVKGYDDLISFYIAVPEYLEDYISQQFLTQYPYCQIEQVPDYNIFKPKGVAAAGHLQLIKHSMYPILTYKKMQVDPLTSLLTGLSKIPDGQAAAVQVVMRSAKKEWRQRGVKVASDVHQGKSLKEAMSGAKSGPVAWLFGPQGLLGTSVKPTEPKEPKRLSPMEEEAVKSIEEKASRAGMDVNVRIVTFAPEQEQAKNNLDYIINSFAQYSNYEYANGFRAVIKGSVRKTITDFIYRIYDDKLGFVLNTEEMTSLWHLPIPGTEVPNIRWLQSRKLPPPVDMPEEGLLLGENFYRGEKTLVRIKDNDRRRHMYIIGMTGTGKSWLTASLVIQDIQAGKGVCVVDPHGSLVEDILPHIPKDRLDDVILFDPSDLERPIGLNMLEAKSPHEMDFAAQEMINIFYKLLPDPAMAGPMFEHYMRNALLALMADTNDPGTLVELPRIFTDDIYRRKKLRHVKDLLVRDFWEREYKASQKGSTASDMLSYVISKTGRFVENELMRNIIGQPKSGFSFRKVMDEKKILLMNLSKGKVGETNSNLLGLIAVSKLQMAALGRADLPEDQRNDFYLYIDEFQNFITDSISIILAEARKYRLNLIMAHQYIAQLTQGGDSKVKDAIFGNVGTVVSFRIGVDDAETIAKQLAPKVNEYDVMNIDKFNAYIRLLIDNTASDTFNMHTFPLPDTADPAIIPAVKEMSRLKYGQSRRDVIQQIVERSKIGQLGGNPVAPVDRKTNLSSN